MDGRDGSWAVLRSDATNTQMWLSVDEDQLNGGERRHTTEQVDYVAFESAGSFELMPASVTTA
eukprot:CAMPEP_0194041340 /NCGR_PEP_ID=MMETSP0009_2-20130614/13262_1 /TAXON_ID=210454 /ORGANISM="Grammatophora oceanica, Strain CCMP 410" /LENGTH=62 /DNA_ID=CAMNT_0038684809 /DNA_START=1 /DNA_END=189 /DNA_ORIENTATION=+